MYPEIKPYETGFLDVGDGHSLYYELSGNPKGRPAVFLHGGPGGGIYPEMRRFFDPAYYKIILYDQRGAGKSTPRASIENNSMTHLVDDLEKLRDHLSVDQWLVSGGSWGSTLSLLYALKYKRSVSRLLVTGVFFADPEGVNWLAEEGGASQIMPDWFAPYRDLIPPERREQGLLKAYNDIMNNGSAQEIIEAVKRFTIWDTAILYFEINNDRIQEVKDNPEDSISLCRIFFHFAINDYTADNRSKILGGVKNLGNIPCDIIHGRYDLICPVKNAFQLHEAYPDSKLHVLDKTGHTTREPNITAKFIEITDSLI